MEKLLNKKHKFSITLRENDSNSCTYRVNRKIYDTLKKYLEPFQSYQPKPRKIKCLETGEIFNSAREACYWLEEKQKREISYACMNLLKQCCRGKQKTSYGYHWEFINEESDKI